MTPTPSSPPARAPAPPRWLADIRRLLPIRAQFVISGNIRDSFLTSLPDGRGIALLPLLRALWEELRSQGFRLLLVADPVEGIRVYPHEPAQRELAYTLFKLKLDEDPGRASPVSLESLSNLMRDVVRNRQARCALLIDFASRLTRDAGHLSEAEHRFFIAAEKLSLSAVPLPTPASEIATPAGNTSSASPPSSRSVLFNPIFWLLNRPQDLPSWYSLDSERVAALTIARPDYETRQAAALRLSPLFEGFAQADSAARARFAQTFADGSDGMTLNALADVAALAQQQGMGLADIDDALRCYKVGAQENPWRKPYLRERINQGEKMIEQRVKGQHAAVVKTLDILRRSVMGMTGAQAKSAGNRPRGVLFFAGPTGVGKTELAKTITQLVFGDESAYVRFDMSEFAEEHSSARLLGAPPGYVGFDAGGELTNAVREKPFSVVLFDEIEKCHPRLLDKFLQILEDGRLTDGRGDTAYFSETVLIFTSNLGITVEDATGRRIPNVSPEDSPAQVEKRVREAISDYFKFHLSRPEILNRIGENIVVFGFITPEVGQAIFAGMVRNVEQRLQDEFNLQLELAPSVRTALLARCTADLSNGGRGIGNQIESALVNPLSRALFESRLEGMRTALVQDLRENNGVVTLAITLS